MSFLDNLFSKKEKEKLDTTAKYDVLLMSCDITTKIKTIQEVRILKQIGLAEAKAFVESAPVVIASGLSMNDALDIKFRFEQAGAVMKVQPTQK